MIALLTAFLLGCAAGGYLAARHIRAGLTTPTVRPTTISARSRWQAEADAAAIRDLTDQLADARRTNEALVAQHRSERQQFNATMQEHGRTIIWQGDTPIDITEVQQ